MLFSDHADQQLIKRHLEIEAESAQLDSKVEKWRAESRDHPDDLTLLIASTNMTNGYSALLEEHALVLGTIDNRGVSYPNFERYNR